MTYIAFILGMWGSLIFFLGIAQLLYSSTVIIASAIFLLILILLFKQQIFSSVVSFQKNMLNKEYRSLLFLGILSLIVLQMSIALIGALGPELAFDSLWYHLTIPKLYLENHSIMFIPGGLLYYSGMPKLGEMFYILGLSLGDETTVSLAHYLFGILCCITLYVFARRYLSRSLSLVTVLIFSSNLVFAWESTTAYIDLIRTFFELSSLIAFIIWWKSQNKKVLLLSGLLIGFAIATKLLAIGTFLLFLLFVVINYIRWSMEYQKIRISTKKAIHALILFCSCALLAPLPWFIFSYIHTGNPVYPFFTDIYAVQHEPIIISSFFTEIWNVFLFASDPVSPIYIMFLPMIVLTFTYFSREQKVLLLFSILSIIMWYLTPRTGGGRFLLPYLPVYSLLCGITLQKMYQKKMIYLYKVSLLLIVTVAIITVGYRGYATKKYLPVALGTESKEHFLVHNLDYSFADFYDVDGYFLDNITDDDVVLLFGFHNLYYVNFPYIHESWLRKGDTFTYIATQHADLPKRFSDWELVYSNEKTLVKLYKPPKGECDTACVY